MAKTKQVDPNESQDGAADRSNERRSFFLSAPIRTDRHADLEGRIRNLSAGGMMVEFPQAPDPDFASGMRMSAELRGVGKVDGEIVWATGRRCGVRFDRDIDPELARKPVATGTQTPDYAKALIVPARALRAGKGYPGR